MCDAERRKPALSLEIAYLMMGTSSYYPQKVFGEDR